MPKGPKEPPSRAQKAAPAKTAPARKTPARKAAAEAAGAEEAPNRKPRAKAPKAEAPAAAAPAPAPAPRAKAKKPAAVDPDPGPLFAPPEPRPRPKLTIAPPPPAPKPAPEAPRPRATLSPALRPPAAVPAPSADDKRPVVRLLHEDSLVLGFDKPAGLAVQGGSGVEVSLETAIEHYSKASGKKPRLVHRLDRETSGVMVVARTQPAAAFLSKAFAERNTVKTYLAIVCGGAPEPRDAAIGIPLKKMARNGVDRVRQAKRDEPGAQAARTRYRTLAATPHAALLAVTPETGRLHQIRAHLSFVDRPIVGDGKYGGLFVVDGVKAPRMMLHAYSLDLPHPEGGVLSLKAPPPPSFRKFAAALGLDAFDMLEQAQKAR